MPQLQQCIRCNVRRTTDSRIPRGSPFKRHYVTPCTSRASDSAIIDWTATPWRLVDWSTWDTHPAPDSNFKYVRETRSWARERSRSRRDCCCCCWRAFRRTKTDSLRADGRSGDNDRGLNRGYRRRVSEIFRMRIFDGHERWPSGTCWEEDRRDITLDIRAWNLRYHFWHVSCFAINLKLAFIVGSYI